MSNEAHGPSMAHGNASSSPHDNWTLPGLPFQQYRFCQNITLQHTSQLLSSQSMSWQKWHCWKDHMIIGLSHNMKIWISIFFYHLLLMNSYVRTRCLFLAINCLKMSLFALDVTSRLKRHHECYSVQCMKLVWNELISLMWKVHILNGSLLEKKSCNFVEVAQIVFQMSI